MTAQELEAEVERQKRDLDEYYDAAKAYDQDYHTVANDLSRQGYKGEYLKSKAYLTCDASKRDRWVAAKKQLEKNAIALNVAAQLNHQASYEQFQGGATTLQGTLDQMFGRKDK